MEMGSSQGSSQQSSQQGFRDLPPQIQNAFIDLAMAAQGMIGKQDAAYSPMSLTDQEMAAINRINAGFAPTEQTIRSDVGMQMNPFDDYVISEINRQAQGDNSILQQNLAATGQLGSNRQILGANDIDLSRTNQIGAFRQGQYNSALGNALTTLPQWRASDAQGILQGGNIQRNLAMQQKQSPVSALKDISAVLGVLPTNSGQSSGSSDNSSFNFGLQW